MAVQADRRIRSVAVLGAGIVGLSAALAFARALPGLHVSVIETAPDPAALADRMPATLPTVHRFHAAIGVDELDLVRRGIAVHHLGTRFEAWGPDGTAFYHVYGDYGLPAANVPFHLAWLRARRQGKALAFDRYAAAARLAEAGKFVHPSAGADSPLTSFLYGLRFDPERYRDLLLAKARALPIGWDAGEALGVDLRADGSVAALMLDGARRIEADLFLDCAGPSAPLSSRMDSGFESWSDWLPCRRLGLEREEGAGAPTPSATVTGLPDGWRSAPSFPGGRLRLRAGGEGADGLALRPGRRTRPWVRNVLALGDAAATLDPLENANLHLAHSAILRAIELLPGRDGQPVELAEYDRRTADEVCRVRDFVALHYLRGRRDGPFWAGLAERRPPDSLARTLDQFEARGRLPFYEEESFDSHGWLAVLLGLGILPKALDPVVGRVPEAQAEAGLARYAAELEALPARLPSYPDYLARMTGLPA